MSYCRDHKSYRNYNHYVPIILISYVNSNQFLILFYFSIKDTTMDFLPRERPLHPPAFHFFLFVFQFQQPSSVYSTTHFHTAPRKNYSPNIKPTFRYFIIIEQIRKRRVRMWRLSFTVFYFTLIIVTFFPVNWSSNST